MVMEIYTFKGEYAKFFNSHPDRFIWSGGTNKNIH